MRSTTSRARFVFILVCCVGFAAVSVAVALGATKDLDRTLLSLVQRPASFPLDLFASLITMTGRLEVTGLAALVLAFIWSRREGWPGLAPLVLFAAVAVEAAFKFLVPHAPPPTDALRDFNLLQVVRGETPYAYPSGHVVRVTFLSLLIAERVPKTKLLFTVYVAIVCITRVYVGAHWPSDVIGGAFFGALAALIATPGAMFAGRTLARLRG